MRAKKSLGQHFLQDKKALEQIIAAADLKVDDNVLEIGPGTGVLSGELLKRAKRVLTIEKDETLVRKLVKDLRFTIYDLRDNSTINNQQSTIVMGDVLKINLPRLIEQNNFKDYKVVANIPYYITGKIIRLLLETKHQPKLIVLLVQKEVAERICTKAGDLSILAVSVQYFGFPEIIDVVPRKSFVPAPKVDSAILRIVPFDDQVLLQRGAREFFKVVKAGFASPRKTLLNNLSAGLQMSKDEVAKIMGKYSLDIKLRAEDLSIKEWKMLSKEV